MCRKSIGRTMTSAAFAAVLGLSAGAWAQTVYTIDPAPSAGLYPRFVVTKNGAPLANDTSITNLLDTILKEANMMTLIEDPAPVTIQFGTPSGIPEAALNIGAQTVEIPGNVINRWIVYLSGRITSSNGNATIKIPQKVYVHTTADIINTGGGYAIDNGGRLSIEGGIVTGNSNNAVYHNGMSFALSGSPTVNGIEIAAASGKINIDASFTPSTRTYGITLDGEISEGREVVNGGVNYSGTFALTNTGWKLAVSGNNLVTAANSSAIDTFTVTFNLNGGTYAHSSSSDVDSPQRVAYGGKVIKPIPDPIREGFTFDGWGWYNGCVSNEYSVCAEVAILESWNFDTDTVTSNIELIAQWASTNAVLSVNRNIASAKPLLSLRGNTLTLSAPANTVYGIRLIDVRGKTVARYKPSGGSSISLAKIPSGRYLVEARGAGKVERMAVVVGVR